jgi:hypothetical protein
MPVSWLDLLEGEQILWRNTPSKWMVLPSSVCAVVFAIGYLSLLYTDVVLDGLRRHLLYSLIAIPLFTLPLGLTELKRRNVEYITTAAEATTTEHPG